MTFTEIVTEIAAALNISSTEGTTRIGRLVNICYREVTTKVQMQLSRRVVAVGGQTVMSSKFVTFEDMEKVTRVYNDNSGSVVVLQERTVDQLRVKNPGTGDPTEWAPFRVAAGSVTILLNVVAQEVMTLRADGYETTDTLSGSQEPSFPESWHDILIHGVLQKEFKKKEDLESARDSKADFEQRMSDLRMWHAKKLREQGRQGQNNRRFSFPSAAGTGGGSSSSLPDGTESYEQSGNIHFNPAIPGSPPFTVEAGSGEVENLDAALLNGATADEILAEAAVTLAGQNYLSIAAQVITAGLINLATHVTGKLPFANIADVTASRLLGRRAGSAGAADEITFGTGLNIATTVLSIDGWSQVAFSAGNFTGNNSMTWTVASGDQATLRWHKLGTKITVAFVINTSTVGGTPSTALQIAIPGGLTAAAAFYNPVLIIDNNVRTTGYATVSTSGAIIQISRTDGANFTASTDLTYVLGEITFETNS